eukprot:scaffold123426_cov31-Tisochrysis_lutea.AAC.6
MNTTTDRGRTTNATCRDCISGQDRSPRAETPPFAREDDPLPKHNVNTVLALARPPRNININVNVRKPTQK